MSHCQFYMQWHIIKKVCKATVCIFIYIYIMHMYIIYYILYTIILFFPSFSALYKHFSESDGRQNVFLSSKTHPI